MSAPDTAFDPGAAAPVTATSTACAPRPLSAMALFAALALAMLWLRPLLPVDETRYLAVAWEMHQSGDYLVPTVNHQLYTHKPPLLFWAINLLWGVFGVSEGAARLVGPLFSLLAIGLTARLAGRLWRDDAGGPGRAAWALTGLLPFALFGGATMFDTALSVAVLLGLLALVRALSTGRWRWWAGLGAALALGGLAKGPVILVHLVPVALLAPFWARGLPHAGARRCLAGLSLAVAVGVALISLWLVPAILEGGPAYRDAILWTQSAGRIAASFAHARPVWWFAMLLPILLFPWVWMPGLWRRLWRQLRRGTGAHAPARAPADTGLRLTLAWAGAAFVLFSLISGKQIHYLIPEMPAVALAVARLAGQRPLPRASLPAALVGTLGLALLLAGLGLIGAGALPPLLTPHSALTGVGLTLLAVAGLSLGLDGLRGGTVLTLGLLLALGAAIRFTALYPAFDSHPIASRMARFEVPGVAFYGAPYAAQFNFAARLGTPVATPADPQALRRWIAAHPGGLVVARTGGTDATGITAPAPLDFAPRETLDYRDRRYGLWHIADAKPEK